jgi:6,7-dimethyl-8-ribityllumazine synthase
MGEPGNERPSPEALDGSDLRIAIVASRYNQDIVRRLLRGAEQSLAEHGCEDVRTYWVPGAMELPLAALTLAESGTIDAVVALGCIINGETAHFQLVSSEAAAGISHVNLDTGVPCSFGVLATFDRDQALARSGPKRNTGIEAAETALEMANLIRRLQSGDAADEEDLDGEGDDEPPPLIQIQRRPVDIAPTDEPD